MTRGLHIVFAVLFLALSVPALAGPNEVFNASAPGALNPAQQQVILTAEDGRYSIQGDYVRDGALQGAVLTNAQVAALLATAPLSSAIPSVPPPDGAESLERSRALTTASKQSIPNFDGGTTRGDLTGGPAPGLGGAALSPVASVNDRALLQSQLLTRLVFTGTPQERAAIAQTVETILETSMGRALAAQFVAERMVSEITMKPIDGSLLTTKNGQPSIQGSTGHTDVSKVPPRVVLNRLFLDVPPDTRRVTMAGTLAHELFGHAFEVQRAKNSGTPNSVVYYYRGDETGSRLIDWTVQTELTGTVYDDNPNSYLGDTEGFYRALWTVNPYYATTLGPADMRDPVPALRARLENVTEARLTLIANRITMSEWNTIRDHFVADHSIPRERFKPTDDRLRDYETYAATRVETLNAIEKRLNDVITTWSSPAGAAELAEIKAGANSPYVRAAESRLAARERGLLALQQQGLDGSGRVMHLPGMTITVSASGESPIEFDELGRMYQEDARANPDHWKK